MSIMNAPEGLLKLLIKKYELFEIKVAKDWEERKRICEACTKSVLCPECGCIKEAKQLIEVETCPKGLWTEEEKKS